MNRRETWIYDTGLTSSSPQSARNGVRAYHQHPSPVRGCQSGCCTPRAVDEAERGLWRGIAWALALEVVGVLIGVGGWIILSWL